MYKAIIAGSRSFNTEEHYKLLEEVLEPLKNQITEVVSGGAKGADYFGELWATKNNIY